MLSNGSTLCIGWESQRGNLLHDLFLLLKFRWMFLLMTAFDDITSGSLSPLLPPPDEGFSLVSEAPRSRSVITSFTWKYAYLFEKLVLIIWIFGTSEWFGITVPCWEQVHCLLASDDSTCRSGLLPPILLKTLDTIQVIILLISKKKQNKHLETLEGCYFQNKE